MIEFHGRLSVGAAIDTIRRLARFDPLWCEEPVTPDSLDLLAEVKRLVQTPVAAGERLYTQADFHRLISLRAADVVQMDVTHCGGIWASRMIAAMAAVQDLRIAPHCSVGPVALAACMQLDACTPNVIVQEAFAEFDVSWRHEFVGGCNPVRNGTLIVSDAPGLGVELNEQAIADHPYVAHVFPACGTISG